MQLSLRAATNSVKVKAKSGCASGTRLQTATLSYRDGLTRMARFHRAHVHRSRLQLQLGAFVGSYFPWYSWFSHLPNIDIIIIIIIIIVIIIFNVILSHLPALSQLQHLIHYECNSSAQQSQG